LGKQANCQVAVSVHAVTDTASCPLPWRLFVPEEWADDAERRRMAGVPGDIGHREKWRLALDITDELAGWDLTPPVLVADAGYGRNAGFHNGLDNRRIGYVVAIRSDVTVRPASSPWSPPPTPSSPNNAWPQKLAHRPHPLPDPPGNRDAAVGWAWLREWGSGWGLPKPRVVGTWRR
jgi:SRSO17 transposase